jgi:chorismate lyase/3-hydroxybenzoate synthase
MSDAMTTLDVSYSSAPLSELLGSEQTLFVVDFAPGTGSVDPKHVVVDLESIQPALREVWSTGELVRKGREGEIAFAQTDSVLFAQLSIPATSAVDLALATRQAYEQLLSFVRQAGFGHLLRMWNYLSEINDGEGDLERYRQFCLGRAQALHEAGLDDALPPAATAVGVRHSSSDLLIYLLAARQPGQALENPRQVSAYEYPRRYGPRSPAFSRAMRLDAKHPASMLMISGTASIVGHRSMHPEDLPAQLDETLRNLQMLLIEGEPPTIPAALPDNALVKAYVRRREDVDAVQQAFAGAGSLPQTLILLGDICRSDLLVEVEVIVPARGSASLSRGLRKHA